MSREAQSAKYNRGREIEDEIDRNTSINGESETPVGREEA